MLKCQAARDRFTIKLEFYGDVTDINALLSCKVIVEQFVDWKSVDNIKADPRNRAITLKKNRRTLMVVFCRPDNHEIVAGAIRNKVS